MNGTLESSVRFPVLLPEHWKYDSRYSYTDVNMNIMIKTVPPANREKRKDFEALMLSIPVASAGDRNSSQVTICWLLLSRLRCHGAVTDVCRMCLVVGGRERAQSRRLSMLKVQSSKCWLLVRRDASHQDCVLRCQD
jgi:hypothetical protein